MLGLLDVAERVSSGPIIDEKERDISYYNRMRQLIKEYKIEVPKNVTGFNPDYSLADDAFQAALHFLSSVGTYCINNRRVVKFTEEEIKQAIKEIPSEVAIGLGMDTRRIRRREIEDKQPVSSFGALASPYSEDLLPLVIKNFAQISRIDALIGFCTSVTDGHEIYGGPMEAYATIRETAWMRDGIRKAGRQGMGLILYPISTKASAMIAALDPDYGLRRTDGVLLSLLPDMKMELDFLTSAIVFEQYGCFKCNGGGEGYVEGFCGGLDGAIIESIARNITAWMVYRDSIQNAGVLYFSTVGGKMALSTAWPTSVVHQALRRNTNIISMDTNCSVSGPGTEAGLLEKSARAIASAINGSNLYDSRAFFARENAAQTPLEPEFAIEVTDATIRAGIKRADGGEIIRKIEEKFVGKPPEEGKSIRECYNLEKHLPSKEYQNIYEKVKKQLADLGLKFE